MSEANTWWLHVEPPVIDLAKRIASKRGLRPDDNCLPYPGYLVETGAGSMTIVAHHDLCPVWSTFVGLARMALETRDEQAIDDAVPVAVTFKDEETQDERWKRERGLDGEAEE